jgi:hypothetical protein
MSLQVPPTLGSKPVALKVSLPKSGDKISLADVIRSLYQKEEFCDANLVCGEKSFPCHKAVLVAKSQIFKEGLAQASPPAGEVAAARQEIRLVEVNNPEAVRFMLDYMYEMDAAVWKDYNPATQEINKDVLRLAQRFQLPGLTQRAMHWLSKDITTGNVIERLAICSEFGLDTLRGKIIEQLTTNRHALQEVAHAPQIMQFPELMQALLKQTAALGVLEEEEEGSAKRRKGAGKGAKGGR